MVQLSGEKWEGSLHFNETSKARGRVNSYSWYFQSKNNSWLVEIAEDQDVEPNELPLVGYGCGGWLYECSNEVNLPDVEVDFIKFIKIKLPFVFQLFNQGKLTYLPAVSCPCSD